MRVKNESKRNGRKKTRSDGSNKWAEGKKKNINMGNREKKPMCERPKRGEQRLLDRRKGNSVGRIISRAWKRVHTMERGREIGKGEKEDCE